MEYYTFCTFQSDLRSRNGHRCLIVRPLTYAEADLNETGPMFRIRFEDGSEIDAFKDELIPIGN